MTDDPIDILIRHHAWAMRKVLARCAELSEAQLHQKFEMGLGSVHDTLLHIIAADRYWTDRIGERELRPFMKCEDHRLSAAELAKLLEDSHRDLRATAESLRAGGRLADVLVSRQPPGKRFTKAVALIHTMTHAVHHRAQVLNMLRHLQPGRETIDLDLPDWQIEEEN